MSRRGVTTARDGGGARHRLRRHRALRVRAVARDDRPTTPSCSTTTKLRALAESDLFWDTVVAIEPAGEEEVYDLTVPGPACWLADGIVSHNSGAIEQDADIVMFIFREEEYKPTEENRGIAEIIIGKQRNGPTGSRKLAFIKEFTRFENLDWRGGPQ